MTTEQQATLDDRLVAESNRTYELNPATVWIGIIGGCMGLLLFGSMAYIAAKPGAFASPGSVLGVFLAVGSVALLLHAAKLYGRTLQITASGIAVLDRRGNELGSLRWIELHRVTERRRMAQLALWDSSGNRRVLVDQQFENFLLIRSRVLAEYQRVFTPQPLPWEFKSVDPPLLETFLFGVGVAFFSWCVWSTARQHHPILSLLFLSFATMTLLFLLNLYPQLRGPSLLLEDRIVLRTLFKTMELYKKDVIGVHIRDLANPRSAVKFSLIVVESAHGKPMEITSRYGSIPEIYLTLHAWLARR